MSYLLYPKQIFLIIYIIFHNIHLTAQSKHALLIGISEYPENSGWVTLNAKNDIDLINSSLLAQGFPLDHITTIVDNKATKKNILYHLDSILPSKIKAGDILYIHFSGHGQQTVDANGDEIDGYDEAIVPYDSPKLYKKGVYEGEQLIRDEELGALLQELQKQLGQQGHLLVTLDACHSGTGTRGIGVARGTDLKMAAPDYIAQNNRKIRDQNNLSSEGKKDYAPENLAPITTFFSTSANQLSYEYINEQGKGFGFLSYAFCKAINTGSVNTYGDLFDEITLEISKQGGLQIPQMEGTETLRFLGGNYSQQADFFKVKEIIDPSLLTIHAGTLHGISEGSIVSFYRNEASDLKTSTPIAKGKVEYADVLESDIVLTDLQAPTSELLKSKIFIKERFLQHSNIKVQINLPDGSFQQSLQQQLISQKTIKIVKEQGDLILIEKGGKVKLINQQETELISIDTTKEMVTSIIKQIKNYAHSNFLRKLESENKKVNLEVQLVNSKKELTTNNFTIGDIMQIQITNHGSQTAYYQIVDIQPDNQFSVIVPFGDYQASEFFIEPGDTKIIPTDFEIYYPIGKELLKVIASNSPIDLKPIIYPSTNTKGMVNNVGITSVVFEIKE